MSLDTFEPVTNSASIPLRREDREVVSDDQWAGLKQKILHRAKKVSTAKVFGDSDEGGGVYRWGIAASTRGPASDVMELISRLACDRPRTKKCADVSLDLAAESFLDWIGSNSFRSPADSAVVVAWAAAMPSLAKHLQQQEWWDLLAALQQLRESVLQRNAAELPNHLILAGELGLTLAWRLGDFPSCRSLEKSAADAVAEWCAHEQESISAAVAGGLHARLVLASLIRCRAILKSTTKRKFKQQQINMGISLATWVAAMTDHTGATAFSDASRQQVSDDLSRHGLLRRAVEFDSESLEPATAAALGENQTGGRLAWEVCLPASFMHSEDAKLAIMFPDWDVRRGRMHVDYSGEETGIEMYAGRTKVLKGDWQVMLELDDDEQQACGDWRLTCEYTDDDVHYLELEQPWTGGLLLQRQFMLIRDDRCVLLADSVLPDGDGRVFDTIRKIRYFGRFPLAPNIVVDPETETHELFLSDGRRRGMVLPLAASEWRVGPTEATLKSTDDGHVLLSTQGVGRLYAPLWFDFQQRRFERKRTWRQLTVADELRIVGRSEAVGYRVQVGSEHWLVYRSLAERRCRSMLGQHLIADFLSGRFDASDGSLEDLVTVDDAD